MRAGVSTRRGMLGAGCALALTVGVTDAEARLLRVGDDGRDLATTLELAEAGDVVEVPAGVWRGPIQIRRSITLRGTGGVIDGGGQGQVVRVVAPRVVLEGLSIRGSGKDLGAPDACIYTAPSAHHTILRHNVVSDCGFGIWLHEAVDSQVVDNQVEGNREGHRSDRGNGIHLFNSKRLEVRGNVVRGGRDGIYVSATDDSFIEDNVIEGARYGVHYMYSYRNTVRGNDSRHNAHGYALMQSRELIVTGNVAADNEGHGIMFRDAQKCVIAGNQLLRNGDGFFFYSSTENEIKDNWVIQNEVGAKIWAGSLRNAVSGNRFIGNRVQVFYVASEDLVWGEHAPGNFWGDYLGWDQDGDGVGDRPYRVDSFTTRLIHQYPAAALLLRSPALELLSHLEQSLPLLRAFTVVDRSPRIDRQAANSGGRP